MGDLIEFELGIADCIVSDNIHQTNIHPHPWFGKRKRKRQRKRFINFYIFQKTKRTLNEEGNSRSFFFFLSFFSLSCERERDARGHRSWTEAVPEEERRSICLIGWFHPLPSSSRLGWGQVLSSFFPSFKVSFFAQYIRYQIFLFFYLCSLSFFF